jgi:peptidoglycan/LPS O-acetylase OafA/YrhL
MLLGLAAAVFLACGCVTFGPHAFIGAEPMLPGASILALEIVFAGVVVLCATHAGKPFLSPLRARWLTYVGTISYGVYLFHLPIFAAVAALAEEFDLGNGLLVKTARISLVFLVPMLSWHLVERPVLSLKRLLDYQQEKRPSELEMNAPSHDVSSHREVLALHRESCCHVPTARNTHDSKALI